MVQGVAYRSIKTDNENFIVSGKTPDTHIVNHRTKYSSFMSKSLPDQIEQDYTTYLGIKENKFTVNASKFEI